MSRALSLIMPRLSSSLGRSALPARTDSLSFWLCWASSRNLRAAALCAVAAGTNAGVLLVEAAGVPAGAGTGVAKAFGGCCWGAGACCGGADVDNASELAAGVPPKGVWGCAVLAEPAGWPKALMKGPFSLVVRVNKRRIATDEVSKATGQELGLTTEETSRSSELEQNEQHFGGRD